MTHLETALTNRYQGTSCVLFARGSTGLYALFRQLREERGPGEVLIPGICCEWVVLAALYAGLAPVIVDVDPKSCGLSVDSVRKSLSPDTRAVLVVYVFGVLFDIAPFLALQRDADFVLIEDLAQAVGGRFAGQEAGCGADFTLLSFGDKILTGAGGALVQRCAGSARSLRYIADALPAAPSPLVLQQKATSLRNVTHGLYDLHRAGTDTDVATAFRPLIPHYRDLIVRKAATPLPEDALLAQLEALDHEREARYRKYLHYRGGIANPAFRLVELPEGSVCWRCSLLAESPEHAQGLAIRLRQSGLHASNHYFPLDALFGGAEQPNNRRVGSTLVNLWVDRTVTPADLERTVDVINGFRLDD